MAFAARACIFTHNLYDQRDLDVNLCQSFPKKTKPKQPMISIFDQIVQAKMMPSPMSCQKRLFYGSNID
jgi:hypothetical protein